MSVSVDAVTENFVIFGSSLEPLALEGRIPLRNCLKLIHNLILSIASVFRFAIFAPYLVTSREDGHDEH